MHRNDLTQKYLWELGRKICTLRKSKNLTQATDDNYSELNNAIKTIEKTLQEYKRFNWYSCSEEELEIARTKVKTLLKLANTITMELK